MGEYIIKGKKMLLTNENLKLLYKTFVRMAPFDALDMPEASEVKFKVIKDEDIYGLYEPEPHIICVSAGRCSHFDTIVKTLLHEMIHMYCFLEGENTYEMHSNRLFKKLIKKTADLYGFDPKEL